MAIPHEKHAMPSRYRGQVNGISQGLYHGHISTDGLSPTTRFNSGTLPSQFNKYYGYFKSLHEIRTFLLRQKSPKVFPTQFKAFKFIAGGQQPIYKKS